MDNESCCANEKTRNTAKVKVKSKTDINTSCCENSSTTTSTCCCENNSKITCEAITKYNKSYKWIIDEIETAVGTVPQVATKLSSEDLLGTCKVRLGIKRMDYSINPGIYAVGKPDSTSPVLVTANYKLTFDSLRKELTELNLWIVVLDTKGVNVWCAAGKGTFGTKELINRIKKVRLSEIVTHNTVILPQLGAPGVSAHEVTKQTGFKVVYGTIRAEDIKSFINNGMKATEEMRRVRFNILDRLILTPIELISTFRLAMFIFGGMFLLNLFAVNPFGVTDFYAFVGALLMGCVVTPILLPWIPVRAFSAKGWIIGLIWVTLVNVLNGWPRMPEYGALKTIAYILILPSIAAYYAMNFTGSSTYTSFSGVIKEMKVAVPAIAISIGFGVVMLLLNCFILF